MLSIFFDILIIQKKKTSVDTIFSVDEKVYLRMRALCVA